MLVPRASTEEGTESAGSVAGSETPSLWASGAPAQASTFRQPQVPTAQGPEQPGQAGPVCASLDERLFTQCLVVCFLIFYRKKLNSACKMESKNGLKH